MRRVIGVIALALLLAACGDAGLLDGVGERAQEAVLGDTSTSTTHVADGATGAVLRFRPAARLSWWNDDLPDQKVGEPSYTQDQVWFRGSGARVVQASRTEIASALPGIGFPRLVPEDIGWVTSQLLYDVASATIDTGTSAQFGLWAVEPYTPDQSSAAVFYVGRPSESSVIGEVITEVVEEGISLIWVDGDFRYELFCRATLDEEYCRQMADSVVTLDELLPVVEAAESG